MLIMGVFKGILCFAMLSRYIFNKKIFIHLSIHIGHKSCKKISIKPGHSRSPFAHFVFSIVKCYSLIFVVKAVKQRWDRQLCTVQEKTTLSVSYWTSMDSRWRRRTMTTSKSGLKILLDIQETK